MAVQRNIYIPRGHEDDVAYERIVALKEAADVMGAIDALVVAWAKEPTTLLGRIPEYRPDHYPHRHAVNVAILSAAFLNRPDLESGVTERIMRMALSFDAFDANTLEPETRLAIIYDKMIHPQEQRIPLDPHHVVRMLVDATKGLFTTDAIRGLLTSVTFFPVGSRVRLNGGEVARVVEVRDGLVFQPIVKIESAAPPESANEGRLSWPQGARVDLFRESDTWIKGTISDLPGENIKARQNGKAEKRHRARNSYAKQRIPPRILLAEDDSDLQRGIADTLRKSGYEVKTAGDGVEAMKLIVEHSPDLLLLDIKMPGLDGAELLLRIRGQPRLATIPAIVITVYGSRDERLLAQSLGVAEFLAKPFNPSDLLAAIRRILGSSP